MAEPIEIPAFIAVTLGFAVFLAGTEINARVEALRRYNIPEPVTGGLLASLALFAVYLVSGLEFEFDLQHRDFLLVLFFAGIGLNARFADLVAGGRPLLLLLLLTVAAIVVQNLVGIAGAIAFGFPAKSGVLFGSASLIGGHGTAIAWAPQVAEAAGLGGATELGVAVATLGLVVAALVGGPVAKFLVEKHDLTSPDPDVELTVGIAEDDHRADGKIDHQTIMRVLMYLNVAIILGFAAHEAIIASGVNLPLFVPCLIMAILVANLRAALFPKAPPISRTPALGLISEFSLGVFLAMSLMSLQLWTIAGDGLAIGTIVATQTVITVAFVIFGLFAVMGRNYMAAVLASGFAGFSLGATPTAIANMTAVTKQYGPSPIAFIVLPLVSAFFVDIANAVVIQTIVNF
ncbi:sodium/glutamate symporter [Ruegeria sediminis]|uniref:Sodium/glutamate symporter n=1 Tax=Ruegeria sediminis TaxID=2583820 RepID=A0ABY2X290_9RHOB|nr:sodium/glutamate symporter [Ruegeria sediminis]TMV09516.1 sodium/glutamate symporter [Ruegeria sediminis]